MSKKEQTETNETAITKEERDERIAKTNAEIMDVVNECGIATLQKQPPLVRSIMLADGISRLREIVTPGLVKRYFMPMQGHRLGFVTDRDKDGGYDVETVRGVLVEALLRGFHPVGNEFNIIAGNFYGAQAGYERQVREYQGLQNFQYRLGVPQQGPGATSLIPFDASWQLNGKDMVETGREPSAENSMDTRLVVRTNSGQGPDAALGKAKRKLFALIYTQLTGLTDDSIDTDGYDIVAHGPPASIAGAPQGRRMELGGRRNEAQPEREPGED